MAQNYDTAILGGGIAGYTAALTAKSLRLNYLWLGEEGYGEKLNRSEYVRNFPAFTGNGKAFAAALDRQREKEGVLLTPARIDGIYATGNGFLLTQAEKQFSARTVILATGVSSAAQVAGEREYLGRGVSYCAVCDGALYRGKKIAAVLSSKEYEHEAEYLAGFASEVHVFCTYADPRFYADNIIVEQGVPVKVTGGARVESLATKTGELSVDGVFFLRNATPPYALVGGLKTEGAHVVTAKNGATNIKGLFAAGDVTGRPYQYVKAAGEGSVAAYAVNEYLKAKVEA